ncbi:hypothetical protein FP2506_03590 [Fulvimarina pelagi HTCC2506]|uniref:Uncharacterized protein n=2 Tax=Fulvimarina pelagi TaxID=217511 RepID=Q0FZK0_9HYPH|nr:hypothetical protein [Fulvimarina pelagi]EAU40278.1 hypothetical protein FP2506_03590 [Fulvimarina pelagi HTCC2506]BAT31318.1 hypothetical protein [Fulvimarina pelagi]
MPVGEIMGYVAAGVTGLIVVMRLIDTYFSERRRGRQTGDEQLNMARIAVFQPTAELYRHATLEQLMGEIHARIGEIHHVVMAEDEERKAIERAKLAADLEELETLRRKERERG